jgi:hypothetical protein
MSYVADMHQEADTGHFAVGWLHPDHPFPQGDVPEAFLARLKKFALRWGDSIDALGWGAAGGYHICEFCRKACGSGTFGVPAGDKLYYAPEMIAHYVEAHRYGPPAEFIAAVLACPLPGTPEYVAAAKPFVWRTAGPGAAADLGNR